MAQNPLELVLDDENDDLVFDLGSINSYPNSCPYPGTITITFGDQAENHVGMQKIGSLADRGFSIAELDAAYTKFTNQGLTCQLINLNNYLPSPLTASPATLLIVRQGVSGLIHGDLLAELANLPVDTKAFMRGEVKNKIARYNLTFGDLSQEPDYPNKRGRIIRYDSVPLLNTLRHNLAYYLGDQANNLVAEGNYYYDPSKCGIGFHGDAERKKVVALRLGRSMPLHFQWFHQGSPVGTRVELMLDHQDLYVMSEYTTGYNWMTRKVPTLRHAAGANKYLTISK